MIFTARGSGLLNNPKFPAADRQSVLVKINPEIVQTKSFNLRANLLPEILEQGEVFVPMPAPQALNVSRFQIRRHRPHVGRRMEDRNEDYLASILHHVLSFRHIPGLYSKAPGLAAMGPVLAAWQTSNAARQVACKEAHSGTDA